MPDGSQRSLGLGILSDLGRARGSTYIARPFVAHEGAESAPDKARSLLTVRAHFRRSGSRWAIRAPVLARFPPPHLGSPSPQPQRHPARDGPIRRAPMGHGPHATYWHRACSKGGSMMKPQVADQQTYTRTVRATGVAPRAHVYRSDRSGGARGCVSRGLPSYSTSLFFMEAEELVTVARVQRRFRVTLFVL